MITHEIFDPPMCCSTGVCGAEPDPSARGVRIARSNLAHDPAAFVANAQVKRLLGQWGPSCLPVILRENGITARGRYPTRRELAGLAGLALEEGSA